ncbi:hypothetical protein D3C85_1658540 [compost metagenome]
MLAIAQLSPDDIKMPLFRGIFEKEFFTFRGDVLESLEVPIDVVERHDQGTISRLPNALRGRDPFALKIPMVRIRGR